MGQMSHIVLILVALLLAGLGCKKTIYSGPGGTIREERKGEYTITDEKTGDTVTFGSDRVPDNFPKDVPIYSAKVISSQVSSFQALLSLQTKDKSQEVVAWYKQELKKQGWTMGSEYTIGENYLLNAQKDGASVIINVGPDTAEKSDNTVIAIIWTPKVSVVPQE